MPCLCIQFYYSKLLRSESRNSTTTSFHLLANVTKSFTLVVAGFLDLPIILKFGDYLFLHFSCISIYQVRRFSTIKNIPKLLLVFNPFQANTSFLNPLFSGSIKRKHRRKIDQYIQEGIILSYGLFVEFEMNLLSDTSREANFGKTLKFC